MARPNVTRERLRELLHYNPDTGVFTWLVAASNNIKVGDVAGNMHPSGYMKIQVDRRIYMAHRLAFVYVEGVWPPEEVDHRNGDGMDNRWTNIRMVTKAVNMQNKRSATKLNGAGLLGAFAAHKGKFVSWINIDRKRTYFGVFETAQGAHDAYCDFKLSKFPDWQPQCPCHSHLVQGS